MADFTSRFNELLSIISINDSSLASALGVSKQTISAWRTGVRTPKKLTMKAIAEYFHVTLPWLEGKSDDMINGVIVARFKYLMSENGLSTSDLMDYLGAYESHVPSSSNDVMNISIDYLVEIAKLFKCSSDYLLGLSDSRYTDSGNKPDERELVDIYDNLNDLGQQTLLGTARGLAANPDMKSGNAAE